MSATLLIPSDPVKAAVVARGYAAQGLPIFPLHAIAPDGACTCSDKECDDAGKHPASFGWQRTIGSVRAVEQLWSMDALAERGIGLAVGPRIGIWVLDVDPSHGGDESLARLQRGHGPLEATWESATGGGGRHLFFAWPDDQGAPIRNSAGKVAPGLDTRGVGGYVVLPPSPHASGQRYMWRRAPSGRSPRDGLAPAPRWLLEAVRAATTRPDSAAGTRGARDGNEVLAQPGERHAEAISLCGLMRWWGAGEETIVAAAIAFGKTQCVDNDRRRPINFAKLERDARDVARRYRPRSRA